MIKRLSVGVASLLAIAGCGLGTTQPLLSDPVSRGLNAANLSGQAIPDELIVHVKAGSSPKITSGQVVDSLDLGKLGKFLRVKTSGTTETATAELTGDPAILDVNPNRMVQVPLLPAKPSLPTLSLVDATINDPLFAKQWYLPHIGADRAWGVTKGQGVVVAIVDTGVDYTHPDLKDHVIAPGYSFVNEKPDALDEFGHGTHCAGIAAAIQGNGIGGSGVAPEARILPVEVLGPTGGGNLYDIAKGIKYAADYGVANKVHVVINLSLGGPATTDSVTYTAGWYATSQGALPVAAAGNSNTAVGVPARWNNFYMPVSAIDENDQKASFSNFGPEISVGAPGTNIWNTTPTYDVPLNQYGYPKFYAALQGTSMACPVVTGTCALVWSLHPNWDWKQVRHQVEVTALDLGPVGHDDIYGYGLVQPAAAVGAGR